MSLTDAVRPSRGLIYLYTQILPFYMVPHCLGLFFFFFSSSLLVRLLLRYFESPHVCGQTPTAVHYSVANPIRTLDNMAS